MTRHAGTWQYLVDAGIAGGEPPELDVNSPWYVRALTGIAGWIAAIFLLGFVGIGFRFVMDNAAAAIVTGMVVLAGACGLFVTRGRNTFVVQLGLAASFTGQALIIVGIVKAVNDGPERWLVIAALEALLAIAIPNSIYRTWSAMAAGIASAMALTWIGAYELTAGLLMAGAAAIWLNEFNPLLRGPIGRSIGYGLTLALIVVQATFFKPSIVQVVGLHVLSVPTLRWIGQALPGAVLVAVVACLLLRAGEPLLERNGLLILVAAATLGIVSYNAPGIATGLTILLLGYAHGNRTLVGLGVAALLGFISAYYYLLDIPLLRKSLALAITGTVALAARSTLLRWIFTDRETTHA